MGKRSRTIATRRNRNENLEKSTQRRALTNLRAAAFCCVVAIAAERRGASSAVAWLTEYLQMSEDEAAESIAIGRRLMAR